jgi:DNA modification methylase
LQLNRNLTRDEWIEWARPIWYGIKESDTLNAAEARSSDDERHICPLQIGTIERCVRLWSNRGETVLTPFMGIGSEVYTAVKLGRKGIGCELNPNYYRVAIRNIQKAERDFGRPTLDDLLFPEIEEFSKPIFERQLRKKTRIAPVQGLSKLVRQC